MKEKTKQHLSLIIKLCISTGILYLLLHNLNNEDPDTLRKFIERPKEIPLLGIAFCCFALALLTGVLRLRCLLATQQIQIPWRNACRLGFLAYMLDFVALGTAGGDLFKGLYLIKDYPNKKPSIVATLFVDRIVGFYALLVTASIASLFFKNYTNSNNLQSIQTILQLTTLGATIAFLLILFSNLQTAYWKKLISRIPYLGSFIEQVIDSLHTFRQNRNTLLVLFTVSIFTQILITSGFFFIANGISDQTISWISHILIVPIALISGIIPLPMEALGVLDYVLGFLYVEISPETASKALGLMVAMVYRLTSMIIALIGIVLYLFHRKSVKELLEKSGGPIE